MGKGITATWNAKSEIKEETSSIRICKTELGISITNENYYNWSQGLKKRAPNGYSGVITFWDFSYIFFIKTQCNF